jgi:hypothetical protein
LIRIDGKITVKGGEPWQLERVPPSHGTWHLYDDNSNKKTVWRRIHIKRAFPTNGEAA